MIIQIKCQHCNQEFEDEALERTVFCPHCGKETSVRENQTPRTFSQPAIASTYAKNQKINPNEIRKTAGMFVGTAIVFGILGLVGLVFTILMVFGQENVEPVVISSSFTGAAIAIAFWFYLIGQIIHIRANTHKD